jgi:hypothetical protein
MPVGRVGRLAFLQVDVAALEGSAFGP